MDGIIYILINETMPGLVKVGMTTSTLEQRVADLSRATGVPLPFEVFYAAQVNDIQFVEERLHRAFDSHRINPKREFFRVAPEDVVAALQLAEIKNITPKKDIVDSPEEQQALNQIRSKRPSFSFDTANIPVGADLIFARDENIRASVVDNKSILLDGVITSLSESARKILGYEYAVAGTLYWTYEGETLDERRRKIENTNQDSIV